MFDLFRKPQFYMMMLSVIVVIKITKDFVHSGTGAILIINAIAIGAWGISLGFSGAKSASNSMK
jgi:hypothetical protein